MRDRSASRYNGTVTELWTDPEWLAGAHAWVEEQFDALGLVRTGHAEQPHVTVWSTVLKAPTTAGPVWFKANHGPLRHEAALVTLLAERVPDQVEPLLAADPDRGWMLMRDAGTRMRELVAIEASLERWHPVLDSVARISVALEDDVDALLANRRPRPAAGDPPGGLRGAHGGDRRRASLPRRDAPGGRAV